MYRLPLPAFSRLFADSAATAPAADAGGHFAHALYTHVCRMLFDKDKPVFALLLAMSARNAASSAANANAAAAERQFVLSGTAQACSEQPATADALTPALEWLPERAVRELRALSNLQAFAGVDSAIAAAPDAWRAVADAAEPHAAPLPGAFHGLDAYYRMLLTRALRPDALPAAAAAFVAAELGPCFAEAPPTADLAATLITQCGPTVPLVLVHERSSGGGATSTVRMAAEEAGPAATLSLVSLGTFSSMFTLMLRMDAAVLRLMVSGTCQTPAVRLGVPKKRSSEQGLVWLGDLATLAVALHAVLSRFSSHMDSTFVFVSVLDDPLGMQILSSTRHRLIQCRLAVAVGLVAQHSVSGCQRELCPAVALLTSAALHGCMLLHSERERFCGAELGHVALCKRYCSVHKLVQALAQQACLATTAVCMGSHGSAACSVCGAALCQQGCIKAARPKLQTLATSWAMQLSF